MPGWATRVRATLLAGGALVALSSCGPVKARGRCGYSELVGKCALMEVDDGDWIGPTGVLRARYRIVETENDRLSYHLILKASCDPEYHDYAKRFLRDQLTVDCRLGALSYGRETCAQKRVILDLPEPERDLALTYEVTHVSAKEARVTREQPFGDGSTDAWP